MHSESFEQTGRVYRVDSTPLILSQGDYCRLAAGVTQRARVIQAFLKDHFSGQRSYRDSGIIPESVVEQIIARWEVDERYLNLDDFPFVYGPDIIRDASGQFVVIEDNLTVVAGISFAEWNRRKLFEIIPEYRDLFAHSRQESFLNILVREFRKRARPCGGVALLQYDISALTLISDKAKMYVQEQHMYEQLLQDYGIEVVKCNPLHRSGSSRLARRGKRLVVEPNDRTVWLEETCFGRPTGGRRQIGFVYIDIRLKHLYQWAAPGLMQAYQAGQVSLSHGPGVEIFNDKVFYPFMDALIRLYDRQAPILKNLRTVRFVTPKDDLAPDWGLIDKVFSQPEAWVIKRAVGRSGEAVWIGRKLKADPKALRQLRKRVAARPWEYIAQEYVASSRLGAYMVDLRPLAYVAADEVYVTHHPWSRGVSPAGNGKHNVASNVGQSVQPVVEIWP